MTQTWGVCNCREGWWLRLDEPCDECRHNVHPVGPPKPYDRDAFGQLVTDVTLAGGRLEDGRFVREMEIAL